MIVRFTMKTDEELRAAGVGFARQENAVRRGLEPRHRASSLWGGHIESACAELAVALVTGRPWSGENVLGLPPFDGGADVGERTEVRWVAPSGDLHLNIDARRDHGERLYVLVSGFAPTYEIHGYLLGRDAARPEWLTRYPERDVYRVPARALRAIA